MKLLTERRWYRCECNCDECRESGFRVKQLTAIAGGVNIVFEGLMPIRAVPFKRGE